MEYKNNIENIDPVFNVKILTILPQAFPGILGMSLAGTALNKKIWSLEIIDIKEFGITKHKNVDDTPYGGGNGLVMRADVLEKALDYSMRNHKNWEIFYMSPKGIRLSQNIVKEISYKKNVIILCGRFEGIDERIIQEYNMREISLGDFILSGGEIAAQALLDAAIRLIPGVIANQDTLSEESFNINKKYGTLLEYPQYTKPKIWRDIHVPEILLGGNHQLISEWRLKKSLEITSERRPDLLMKNKNKFGEKNE